MSVGGGGDISSSSSSSSSSGRSAIEIDAAYTQLTRPSQNLIHFVLVVGKVVDKTVPHVGVVLVDFITLHGPVCNGKGSRALKHECNGSLGYLHLWWWCRGGTLELFVRDTVGYHATLEAYTTGLKLVAAAGVFAIDETHELGSDVAVIVRRSVGMRGDVPPRGEDQEVGKRRGRIAGTSGEDTED